MDEDFVNYKKPSMFIGSAICDWKCCRNLSMDNSICQNSSLAVSPAIDISADEIFRRYISNGITHAVVIGGLEPFLQTDEVEDIIRTFRENGCLDDFVIYTGYYPEEIEGELEILKQYENIIVKFGRYIPDCEKRHDPLLGVSLISNNQFAERIS